MANKTVNKVTDDTIKPSAELTDPDDIDALLDSVNSEPVKSSLVENDLVEKNSAAEELVNTTNMNEAQQASELTDPDDIISSAKNTSVISSEEINSVEEHDSLVDTKTQPIIEPLSPNSTIASSSKDSVILSAEDLKIQQEINDNHEKIAEFTAEYVTPFLTADFSDIVASSVEEKSIDNQVSITEKDQGLTPHDDLDIDALLDSIQSDDLQNVDTDDYNSVNQAKDKLGDELITSLDSQENEQGFSTENLSQLLTEQSTEDRISEFSPELKKISVAATDYTNEKVLAELLNDNNVKENELIENDALESIGDLDKVDFDDLLADIEQESANYVPEEIDNNSVLNDIGDDLISEEQHKNGTTSLNPVGQEYVSVDQLLNDSLNDSNQTEPYQKENIDVGLGQFSTNISAIDVDVDGSMSAKLDLAKMYIEMSDEENAEVILHEVRLNGDNAQQVKAQLLLDTLKT